MREELEGFVEFLVVCFSKHAEGVCPAHSLISFPLGQEVLGKALMFSGARGELAAMNRASTASISGVLTRRLGSMSPRCSL